MRYFLNFGRSSHHAQCKLNGLRRWGLGRGKAGPRERRGGRGGGGQLPEENRQAASDVAP